MLMRSCAGSPVALLCALLPNFVLLGCGDAPISQAQARIDATSQTALKADATSAGAASTRQDPYLLIRPASVDDPIDPIDPTQQAEIAG